MCGITGWIDWSKDLMNELTILESMTETLTPRGPDAAGSWISRHCSLGHRRLSVIDPENGAQPMTRTYGDQTYIIVYNGELYNALELRKELAVRGHSFRTHCDTEVLLIAYIEWGAACLDRLNGIFAFAVWQDKQQTLFLARDRLGVKPLFYVNRGQMFLFGSEPKAILAHPDFPAEVDGDGLAEIFVLGPARTPGHGIFRHMAEIKPGHFAVYDKNGLRIKPYWQLESKPHADDTNTTAETIRHLLKDTMERQLISDVPVCTLLSGGLDSSALTALASSYYKETGKGELHTYSVDYVDNDKHFKTTAFQPNADAPWIKRMSDFLKTVHHNIEFDTPDLVDALKTSVIARDFPGYADIDASLYLFCKEIKKEATVAISGEAADEIFGGYPWFHREDALNAKTFPWALTTQERLNLLSAELTEQIKPERYLSDRYQQTLAEVPHLKGEDQVKRRMREISYLTISRFMPALLDRKDRMSMAAGLEVRVPYCDHRLVEYVWNIPWEIKSAGDREKGILRQALKGILPDDVLFRKKSPYPKTHNPNYLAAVTKWMQNILGDPSSPLLPLINRDQVKRLASSDGHFNLPFYGQLMNTPQALAYLAQIDTWLREYKISIK